MFAISNSDTMHFKILFILKKYSMEITIYNNLILKRFTFMNNKKNHNRYYIFCDKICKKQKICIKREDKH